jgi:D-alanine-D-alanine ligase
MKIAVVYNRESQKVINLFGIPNREKYGLKAIKRIVDALKGGGHQVVALEGDKDLIDNLEEFMPRALKGERPGMVFNLSYGIQGQARYTHVPSILEMVGIPYVGSGPLAHSLALDKVVAKMIFHQHGLPTPDFVVLDSPEAEVPELAYPMIIKPKNEAVSFGIRIVNDEQELREGAAEIFKKFQQPVLVEQYIEGREINVGLLGNGPVVEAFTPAEIVFGEGGPKIYTYEDKVRRSGREISVVCPAPLDDALTAHAQEIAIRAFKVLGCYDCARVDMRLDDQGALYILEVNSLPSLGEHGSYVEAARFMGLDFPALVNRLVDVASARYFGTPEPPAVVSGKRDPGTAVFAFLTQRRDRIERRLKEWTNVSSRSDDPVGIQAAVKKLDDELQELGMRPVKDLSAKPHVWAWESPAGFDNGTLLIGHLDVPLNPATTAEGFRREPEWLYGEGIASSRAPLVMLEYALRGLRAARRFRDLPLGVLYYTDEGQDCHYSAEAIREAAARARQVLILHPGNPNDRVVTARRGQRKYRLVAEGKALRLGQVTKRPDVLRWLFSTLETLSRLSSRKDRIAVSTVDIRTEAFPLLLPHRAVATLQVSYPDERAANALERKMREIIGQEAVRCSLALVSDRPPMKERRTNARLAKTLHQVAAKWEIPLDEESSLTPSVAGLVPATTPVVCGVGPVARDLYMARAAVQRISLVQRTLLLAEFLLQGSPRGAAASKATRSTRKR